MLNWLAENWMWAGACAALAVALWLHMRSQAQAWRALADREDVRDRALQALAFAHSGSETHARLLDEEGRTSLVDPGVVPTIRSDLHRVLERIRPRP